MANWITKTSNYTAQPKDKIIGDTRNASITIALPLNPGDNIEVKFLKIGSNLLYFDFNNALYKSDSVTTDVFISASYQEVSLIYVDSVIGWIPNRSNIIEISSGNITG